MKQILKEAKSFGNSSHVILPAGMVGKKVIVMYEED